MNNTLFRQSDIKNPFEIYAHMLNECPVYWDEPNNIWAAYSFEACAVLLKTEKAHIPFPGGPMDGRMNEYAKSVIENHIRLSNPPFHAMLREIAMQLYNIKHPVSAASFLPDLLSKNSDLYQVNWVKEISKKLPLIILLKGFCFSDDDIEDILLKASRLIKIVVANKTTEDIDQINDVVKHIYLLIEKHILKTEKINALINQVSANGNSKENIWNIVIANLIGLIIQSYDAGRGILCNSLLQALCRPTEITREYKSFEKFVVETLRYDPPPHNTRRIMDDDLTIGNTEIKKGQTVLLVLAAANRDPAKFDNPDQFNINRNNNNENLTFGMGVHSCFAKHLSINMATETLSWLFETYKRIILINTEINYEPLINVRLPTEMNISLS